MSKIQGTNYSIVKNREGELWYDFGRGWKKAITEKQISSCETLNSQVRSKNKTVSDVYIFSQVRRLIEEDEIRSSEEEDSTISAEDVVRSIINFFSEFHFEPNFRFINTLGNLAQMKGDIKSYVSNYFELTDSPYHKSVREKIKSPEFKKICYELRSLPRITSTINQRFKLYYGSQGTGKTTVAMKETDGLCVVCNSSMLPQDLMEDFCFDDGKPGFHPSALYKAMVDGKKIVLDEINLLPYDSLRFLQGVLDGKSSFEYKGLKVQIKEGFQIIGTMNLVVNGCTYSLPEPLVDRSQELRKFSLSESDLVGALS